jgi:hypothetical protein
MEWSDVRNDALAILLVVILHRILRTLHPESPAHKNAPPPAQEGF